MNRLSRIILGLGCCLITALIILGEYRTERGTILAAELAGSEMKQIRSRFRVEDEEDLHWKPLDTEYRLRSGEVLNRRGVDFAEQRQYDQAIAEFTKAMMENPILGKTYYNRL